MYNEDNLASIYPDIAREWHPTKNGEKKPYQYSPGSHEKVWWLCPLGHTYPAVIRDRTKRGHKCIYCTNQKVLAGFNDMATTNPDLLMEWDFEHNIIKPTEIMAGSGVIKVYWKCEKGHIYQATPNHRTGKRGCPYCSNKKVLIGYNDLATTHPDIAAEWDYCNNAKKPTEIVAGCNKKAHWICPQGHHYVSTINSRTSNGSGCKYCAGQAVLIGFNDLETISPELAKEWDYEKNTDKPTDYTAFSGHKAAWKCQSGHSWFETIVNRQKGEGCPECNKRNSSSFPQEAIYFYIRREYPDALNKYTKLFDNGMEIDVFIPSKMIGIEYDGPYHSTEASSIRDARKYEICQTNGIKLIRIKKDAKESDQRICDILINSKYNSFNYDAIDRFMKQLSETIPLVQEINTEKYVNTIKEAYLISLLHNSLAEKHPEKAAQWDYEKNKGLTPWMFSYGSGQKVWWKCKKGHSWYAAISTVKGCKYCSNQCIVPGENDLASIYPDIAKEWDPTNSATPDQVAPHSSKSYLWVCPKGHPSYIMSVSHRTGRGSGCPLCKPQKVCEAQSQRVYQYTTDGRLIAEYSSCTEASKKAGLSTSMISKACRGKSKTGKGYIWSYEKKTLDFFMKDDVTESSCY